MAIDRPEKLGGGYFAREDGLPLSMLAFIELAQLVLGKGRTIRTRALGKSMTPFIRHGPNHLTSDSQDNSGTTTVNPRVADARRH